MIREIAMPLVWLLGNRTQGIRTLRLAEHVDLRPRQVGLSPHRLPVNEVQWGSQAPSLASASATNHHPAATWTRFSFRPTAVFAEILSKMVLLRNSTTNLLY
jgi:hypothetical protein